MTHSYQLKTAYFRTAQCSADSSPAPTHAFILAETQPDCSLLQLVRYSLHNVQLVDIFWPRLNI